MDETRAKRRRTRKRLLIASLALLLLGGAIAATGGGLFLYNSLMPVRDPLATLEAGETAEVEIDDIAVRYAFTQKVREEGDRRVVGPMPSLTITTAEGESLKTTESDSWQSIGDDEYFQRALVRLESPTTLTITAEVAEDKDSADTVFVTPYINDLTERHFQANLPLWITGGLTAAAAFGLFVLAVVLYVLEPEDDLPSDLEPV